MPLLETSGNNTASAYSGGVAVVPNYIEDVFSTWLYTGNSSTQTINNGIDLAGKGGLVWGAIRSGTIGSINHIFTDTVRGTNPWLRSVSTAAQNTAGNDITSFNNNGFSLDYISGLYNASGNSMVSWTFRKQPKFFDIVTWTGNGIARNISHNLGSVPGCIIVKSLNAANNWVVYHRSLGNTDYMYLNSVDPTSEVPDYWNDTTPTDTTFRVNTNSAVNADGQSFVAYLFAHNAGGFGLTGTDNVISCGSFTSTGTGVGADVVVNLGYEVQYVLAKPNNVSNWQVYDTMRGLSLTGTRILYPNLADAEVDGGSSFAIEPNATGFTAKRGLGYASGTQVIYIAIRRGPMKVPTDATKVFKPVAATPSGSQDTVTTNFPTDLIITTERSHSLTGQTFAFDRLRGGTTTQRVYLTTNTANAETNAAGGSFGLDSNVAIYDNFYQYSGITNPVIYWNFRRAPSFFDEVCFTQASGTQNHNLGVAPELVILKSRSTVDNWYVMAAQNGFGTLNLTVAWEGLGNGSGLGVNLANVTATTISKFAPFGTGNTAVAYLFATCAGVSKVGSYTGNGTTQAISCGFTGGARFVLIKRTDATGGWYVYDTARGMTTSTDPYLFLNSGSPEAATLGSVTTTTGGFTVNAAILAAINTNGASYIYLSIA